MKIRVRTLVLIGMIYCMAFQCKWLSILGLDTPMSYHAERIIYLLMFLYCRFQVNAYEVIRPYCKRVDKGAIIVFLLGLLEIGYTVVIRNVDIQVALENSVYVYIKLLAVYPMLYLLELYGFNFIKKMILLICGISMFYQAIAAFLYNTGGMVINASLIANESWIRNENIRIGSTSLIWVVLIIGLCSVFEKQNILHKIGGILLSIFTALFLILINQSRSLYVAAIAAILLMYLFHEKRSRGKIISIMALLVFIMVFTQSSVFNNFIASFSYGSTDDTLTGRLELLSIIQNSALPKSTLFGFGFIGTTYQLSNATFYFIDYGLIGDLLQLGIFAAVMYIAVFVFLMKNVYILSDCKGVGYDFTVGAIGFLLIGVIGFTVLSSSRNFAIPVVVAISQYFASNHLMDKDNEMEDMVEGDIQV